MLFVRMRKLRAVSLSFSNSLERFRIAARIRSMAVLLRGRVTIAIVRIYHSSQWPPKSSASLTEPRERGSLQNNQQVFDEVREFHEARPVELRVSEQSRAFYLFRQTLPRVFSVDASHVARWSQVSQPLPTSAESATAQWRLRFRQQ